MFTTASHPLPEQKENVRHGEMVFPIQRYTTTFDASDPMVPLHWHEEAELTLITQGHFTCTIQLENCIVKEGDLVFAPPQVLHGFRYEGESATSRTYVFHMNFLGAANPDRCTMRYLAPISNQKLTPPAVIHPDHPIYDRALALFQDMNRAWEGREPGYELILKADLLTIVALLLPYCVKDSADLTLRAEHAEKIKTALEFMESHYGEEIAIVDIANACYFSQYHFMRFFKKHMGVSCGDYLKNLRLEKAARAFASGSGAILDVAMESGFRNLSYFYREFQKKYGVTPKQFIHKCEQTHITK